MTKMPIAPRREYEGVLKRCVPRARKKIHHNRFCSDFLSSIGRSQAPRHTLPRLCERCGISTSSTIRRNALPPFFIELIFPLLQSLLHYLGTSLALSLHSAAIFGASSGRAGSRALAARRTSARMSHLLGQLWRYRSEGKGRWSRQEEASLQSLRQGCVRESGASCFNGRWPCSRR